MTNLKDQLLSDMKGALKAKDSLRLNTIRNLNSDIKYREIDLRKELEDEEIIGLITSQIKKMKEASVLFEKGGRNDLKEKELQEKEILEAYLPAQVSEADLRLRIQEIIKETGAGGPREMGKVMKVAVPEFKGRADNRLVKDLVNEYLNP